MLIFNPDTLISIEVIDRKEDRYLSYSPARGKTMFKSARPEGVMYHFLQTSFYTMDEYNSSSDFPYSYLENDIIYGFSYVKMTFIGDKTYYEYFKTNEESKIFAETVRAEYMVNSFTAEEINMKEGSFEKFRKEYKNKKEAESLSGLIF